MHVHSTTFMHVLSQHRAIEMRDAISKRYTDRLKMAPRIVVIVRLLPAQRLHAWLNHGHRLAAPAAGFFYAVDVRSGYRRADEPRAAQVVDRRRLDDELSHRVQHTSSRGGSRGMRGMHPPPADSNFLHV